MLESQTRFLKYLPRPMILTSDPEAMNFQMCIWLHGHLTNAIRFLFTLYKSLGFKGDTDQACFRYMYHILTQYANHFKAEHCS